MPAYLSVTVIQSSSLCLYTLLCFAHFFFNSLLYLSISHFSLGFYSFTCLIFLRPFHSVYFFTLSLISLSLTLFSNHFILVAKNYVLFHFLGTVTSLLASQLAGPGSILGVRKKIRILYAGANFMRQKFRGKFHQAELYRTSIETFCHVFLPGNKFLSSSEEFMLNFVSWNWPQGWDFSTALLRPVDWGLISIKYWLVACWYYKIWLL